MGVLTGLQNIEIQNEPGELPCYGACCGEDAQWIVSWSRMTDDQVLLPDATHLCRACTIRLVKSLLQP